MIIHFISGNGTYVWTGTDLRAAAWNLQSAMNGIAGTLVSLASHGGHVNLQRSLWAPCWYP